MVAEIAKAENTAPHQDADRHQPDEPDEHQPPSPKPSVAARQNHGEEDQHGAEWTPMLLVGVGAKENKAPFLGDECPAGAGPTAGAAVRGRPDRVRERPPNDRGDRYSP